MFTNESILKTGLIFVKTACNLNVNIVNINEYLTKMTKKANVLFILAYEKWGQPEGLTNFWGPWPPRPPTYKCHCLCVTGLLV